MSTMLEGTQTSLIGTNHIEAERISFLEISPAQVEVTLARIIKRSVTIKPQLLGNLPPNRKLKSVLVIPPEIVVLAPPANNGDKALSVSTTPIYLNSLQSSSRIFCKIIAPPAIQPAAKPWPDVEVVIDVETVLKREQE